MPRVDPNQVNIQPQVILITGNMAAGKSTIAQALAERLPRSVHLRGDLFRRMIVRGRAEVGFELSEEAARQLGLRYELAATVAQRYVQAGFTVVYQDILIGEGLPQAVARLQNVKTTVVVLCPHPEVIFARDAERHKTGYTDLETAKAFDRVLREETPRIGFWLDNSDLTVDETVAAILEHIGSTSAMYRDRRVSCTQI